MNNSNNPSTSEYEKDPRCSGDCEHCPNKTFDNQETYEFICNLDGMIVY